MDISKLTIEQLKSLAYDTMVEAERAQKNLSVINNEIAKKTEIERGATQPKESLTPEEIAENQKKLNKSNK